MPMYTLGHDFVPPPVHAGGLRYHGDAPMVCGLVKAGVVEARAYRQNETFEAAVQFARTEGIIPAPEPAHAIRAVIEEAEAAKQAGEERTILFGLCGHGNFDLAAYDAYLAGNARGPGVLRGRHAGGAGQAARTTSRPSPDARRPARAARARRPCPRAPRRSPPAAARSRCRSPAPTRAPGSRCCTAAARASQHTARGLARRRDVPRREAGRRLPRAPTAPQARSPSSPTARRRRARSSTTRRSRPRGYGYLTTRDGTKLAIDVQPARRHRARTRRWSSTRATATPTRPAPRARIAPIANLLGFAVVDVNMRGTGCSGGAFDYFEPLQASTATT